ncbi:sulfate/molybdate ABC transporter ATP-binding protein [Williamsia sp. CHRR-6]|uniref:sulfate/molybdate ABC transporter ATP-binding protein n=1 Tax=Williamsia sp. CHRR-6 TaxID=2835871 RepID=UPI001BD9F680|nr:ATP-binding cassette domain-containing protein [Williamsia sp. CHRR-6]MBT0567519.1 ATP-binding cassette domain-containing protein [Williamsia sp. CHRR-6]
MNALHARVHSQVPPLDVEVTVGAGRTLAVLGRNGAGKSTLLHFIAGLLRVDGAHLAVGDRTLVDESTFVAPHRRSIALLSQQARLFPHLTVAQNIAFAPSAARRPRAQVRETVARWLAAVDATELADRRPGQLSGGQAQRVAIARAMAADPSVLLLDEPFAALDVDVAARLRSLVARVLADRRRVTVIVTHDIVDALTLADEALVLDAGRVVDHGPVRDVVVNPVTEFAASLAGVNLIAGRWVAGAGSESGWLRGVDLSVVGIGAASLRDGESAAATFAPRSVAVYPVAPQGSPRNVFTGEVSAVDPTGDRGTVVVQCGQTAISAELTWDALRELRLGVGDTVHLAIKATEVSIYPSRSSC